MLFERIDGLAHLARWVWFQNHEHVSSPFLLAAWQATAWLPDLTILFPHVGGTLLGPPAACDIRNLVRAEPLFLPVRRAQPSLRSL